MRIRIVCVCLAVLFLASCGEYNKILKSTDTELKYTYAKKYFDEKKYGRTITLLEDVMTSYVATSQEEEIRFLLAQAYFYDKDYTTATSYYKIYYNKFPKGNYTELARFNAAYGLYLDSPDARLDQSSTYSAIQEFQEFLEYFPQSDKAPEAQNLMFELQEKLAYKEFLSARLYYNLGMYLGNNYEACIVTSREALKNFPFSVYAEEFQILILRARYEMAVNSIFSKKEERLNNTVDEYFNYKNMFPNGKYTKESEKFYRNTLKELGRAVDAETQKAVILENDSINQNIQ